MFSEDKLNITSTETRLLYDIRELLIEINKKLDKEEVQTPSEVIKNELRRNKKQSPKADK